MALTIFRDLLGYRKGPDARKRARAHAVETGEVKIDYRTGQLLPNMTQLEITRDYTDALDAVQKVVNVITDHEGGRFAAAFADDRATGGTDLEGKQIIITSAPLKDETLDLAEAAEVLTGLTAHEIGHAMLTGPVDAAVRKRWGKDPVIHYLANALEDVRLERYMKREYPGIAGAFDITMEWASQFLIPGVREVKPGMGIADRVNFAVAAVRYPEFVEWGTDPATEAERKWWQEWGEQYAQPDGSGVVPGLETAIAHLKFDPSKQEQESEGDGKGEGKGKPKPKGASESKPKPKDDKGSESGADGDDPDGEGEGNPTESQAKPGGDDGEGGGNLPSWGAVGALDPTLDTLNDKHDFDDADIQARIREERKVERMTAGDGFGTMRIQIDL